jgi:biotin carboxyl carrier protein
MKIQVKIDEQVFEVEIEDVHARPVIAVVDGEQFEVWPEDTVTEAGHSMPVVRSSAPSVTPAMAATPTASTGNALKVTAPLPGVIISIDVKAGDVVKHGQSLLTLEAMKMKNAIRSTREGTIAEVHVANGDQVNHGQLLVSFKA